MKYMQNFATILLGAAAIASAAASGNIVLEDRTDFVYESYNDKVLVNDLAAGALKNAAGADSLDKTGAKVYSKIQKESNLGLAESRLRTDFKGQFSNDVKYRFRVRWDKTLGNNKKLGLVQTLDGAIDNAFIQPKFGENLSVKIGKFTMESQAYEWLLSSQDIYLFSSIEKYYVAGNAAPLGIRPILSLDGIGEFTATIANTNLASSEDSLAQKAMLYGAGFTGKFGMFEPLANFTLVPLQDKWSEGQIDAGAGLRVTVDKIIGIVDFQTQTTNGDGLVIAKGLDKVISTNVFLQYKGENFRPQAKVIVDQTYYQKDKTASVLGLSGGLEYYPAEKDKFRYHAIVTDKLTTPYKVGVKGDTQSELKVYLGVSCAMDMWKF